MIRFAASWSASGAVKQHSYWYQRRCCPTKSYWCAPFPSASGTTSPTWSFRLHFSALARAALCSRQSSGAGRIPTCCCMAPKRAGSQFLRHRLRSRCRFLSGLRSVFLLTHSGLSGKRGKSVPGMLLPLIVRSILRCRDRHRSHTYQRIRAVSPPLRL